MDIYKIIKNAKSIDYTICYEIENFTIESLAELAEKAKETNISLRIRAEHSNLHQGVLVEVQRN